MRWLDGVAVIEVCDCASDLDGFEVTTGAEIE